MVQIIAGKKGKGKTKYLLDMANNAVKESKGSIVYLDKSSKHMYELSNKIRLINVAEFPVHSAEAFVGFICGIISQDHDLAVSYTHLRPWWDSSPLPILQLPPAYFPTRVFRCRSSAMVSAPWQVFI